MLSSSLCVFGSGLEVLLLLVASLEVFADVFEAFLPLWGVLGLLLPGSGRELR